MKTVLLSYSPVSHLESNKLVKIPDDCPQSDFDYLKDQCRLLFAFGTNVSLQIVLQRYDSDWESFIDLDEDAVIKNKEKLRIVVTPVLNDIISSVPPSIASNNDATSLAVDVGLTNDSTVVVESSDATCGRNQKGLNPSKKRRILEDSFDGDEESLESTDYEMDIPVMSRVRIKETTEEQPLPDPFPLPRHFSAAVELALQNKKMTKETNSSFLSAVASSMLYYKRFPSREDYTRVAMDIIRTYPFMKPPNGSPTGGIVQSLIDRFKQFRRRKKTERSTEASSSYGKEPNRLPTSSDIVPVCSSDDESMFESQNKALIAELKKLRRSNAAVVSSLIKKTFSSRRKDIIVNPRDVCSILQKYPFLKTFDYLMMEMDFICGKEKIQSTARDCWSKLLVPKIIALANREKESCARLRSEMELLSAFQDTIRALCLLPYLVTDRTKPDHEKIVHFSPASCEPQAVIKAKNQKEPFILAIISGSEISVVSQTLLVIDQEIICEINNVHDYVCGLLASFYVFNIRYTKGCNNFFCFLEMQLLSMNPKKVPASISHFLSRLN